MIDADWLLESARQLNPEPGRPKQTMLRRYVSNLYYAVFHELCRQTANLHVGATLAVQRSERYVLIYRSLDHSRMRQAFEAVVKDRNAAQIASKLGQIFVSLQNARHRADYDPRVRYSRADVRAFVQDVEWALTTLRGVFPGKDLLLTKLIVRDRG